MLRLLTDAEVISKYGDPASHIDEDGDVKPSWRASILETFPLSKPLVLAWGGQATKVSCHKLVLEDAKHIFDALARIPEAWKSINDYGGCYNFRRNARDRSKLSRHAWGIAFDLDVRDSVSGGRIHPLVIQAFYDRGFYWGGFFTTPDEMHFEKAINL